MTNVSSFALSFLLCYCWPSFRNHGSNLHRVLTWLLLTFDFFLFFGLYLLVFSFTLHFWWMGSHPWILYTEFLLLYEGNTYDRAKPKFKTSLNWPIIIQHNMGLQRNLHSHIIHTSSLYFKWTLCKLWPSNFLTSYKFYAQHIISVKASNPKTLKPDLQKIWATATTMVVDLT